ncbi:hypothetical protein D3C73_1202630 [compost metagenome]
MPLLTTPPPTPVDTVINTMSLISSAITWYSAQAAACASLTAMVGKPVNSLKVCTSGKCISPPRLSGLIASSVPSRIIPVEATATRSACACSGSMSVCNAARRASGVLLAGVGSSRRSRICKSRSTRAAASLVPPISIASVVIARPFSASVAQVTTYLFPYQNSPVQDRAIGLTF